MTPGSGQYQTQIRLQLRSSAAAYYQLPGTVIPRSDSYSTSYTYDENGNILSLKRNGKEDDHNLLIEIDDLDYTYDQGNRLLKVKDATGNPAGFDMNGAHTNDQYDYDNYGNLKTDPYKKISNITYNHLNLPVQITFTGGETVEYTYLADGTKIEKTATDSENNTTTTEYRDGFQYKNNILEFFPHAEGYVKSTESVNGYIFNYVFTHTDHLGNIRIKYTKHPQTGELQILEEDHYYPYGLTHEGYSGNHQIFGFDDHMFTLIDVTPDVTDTYKYKFNGMEWQDEFDVNLYDFGARNYDPALVRTFTPDPMAENFYSLVPYSFLNNNPLNTIDPTGALSITLTGQDAKDFFQGLKDDIASKPKNYEDEMDNGIDGSGGGGNVANPNNPIQLDEIIIDNNNSGNFNINLQDRYAGSMNQWQEKTGGKFSSDHALADLQWYISYGNADQEYFQAQLDAQTSAQHKATNNAAELLSYILPTPLAGGAVIGKAPALYKSAKYSKIMYRPLSKANKGYFNFQIGIRNTKTNYHLRLERHQFNTNKGSKIHATHINYGKGGEKHWFLNRVKRSNIKL